MAVTGEGKVDVVPDTAYIDAGITVRNASTVEEARRKLDEANNKVIGSLKNLGIDKKDIKTSNYSINPNIVYRNNQDIESGYNGNASIQIIVRKTDLVSQVIDVATTAGATDVNGPRFAVDDPSKFREEARNKAIKNAREQAQKIASSLGIRLGRVVNMVESGPSTPPPVYANRAMSLEGSVDKSTPDIEQGSETITSSVTLYFERK